MSAISQPTPPDMDRIIAETDAAVGKIRAARAAIGKVIYGQESVVERTMVTILAGGHGPAHRRSRPRQDQAGRDSRHRLWPHRPPHPVHSRPDALRHHRLRGDGPGRRRPPRLPLPARPGVRPVTDGRRDQPRQPAHPIRPAPVDAGVPRDGRRRPARPAGAVPCAGDAEPAGAGGHLSPARKRSSTGSCSRSTSCIRTAPPSGGCCSRPRLDGGARRSRARRDDAPLHPAARPPHAGRRRRGGGDPRPRPFRPARRARPPRNWRRPSPGVPAPAPARR